MQVHAASLYTPFSIYMEAFLSMQQQMPGQLLQTLNLPDRLCWLCICLIKKSSPTPMMLLSSKRYWTSKYKWSVEKKIFPIS